MPQQDFSKYILPVSIGAAVLIGGKKLLETFGIIDSKSESQKKAENEKAASSNAWDPNYWKSPAPGYSWVKILTDAKAQDFTYKIYHAHITDFGLPNFNDDEDAIYGVFRSLTYDTQLSYLCYKFQQRYNKDLLSFLYVYDTGFASGGFLNETEFNVIANIVSKYKSGFYN